MSINIKTVAELAGVSAATVSRVLNSPERVGEATRSRVLSVVRELEYVPSGVARSLSSKKTNTIGVIVPGMSNQFFIELYKGIHASASDYGMDVLLYDTKRMTGTVSDGFTFMKQRQTDGIIYTSAFVTAEYEAVIERLGIPVVLALTESANKSLPAFRVDDVQAAFDAVGYLVSRGHERISMISGPRHDVIAGESRYEGYRLGLLHHGIELNPALVSETQDFRYEDGYLSMKELLSRRNEVPFTAVFTACDEHAIGAMRALHEAGLRVPEDVSVMGFDDLGIASMMTPKLSTVFQPFFGIGAAAVSALRDRIENAVSQITSGIHYMPHRIIGRESVAPART